MFILFTVNCFLLRERREISGDENGVGKNSSVCATAPKPDDVIVGIQVCLGLLYESEDAALKYGRERGVVFEKEIKVKRTFFFINVYFSNNTNLTANIFLSIRNTGHVNMLLFRRYNNYRYR